MERQMTEAQRRVTLDMAAIMATLFDANTGSPASMLYMGVGMDYERYRLAVEVLGVGLGFLAVDRSHYVTLTEKGRPVAAQFSANLKPA